MAKATLPVPDIAAEDADQLPTLLTPRKRQLLLDAKMAAAKTESTSHTKPKLQERRPGFRSEPLTLQPGLKFYSPPVAEIPDVPDPESRRHRLAKSGKDAWPSESTVTSISQSGTRDS
ncbi:unnamed protein product [Symbiodinium natans]|uniref:Uncharacterized protein n=1 Tax=Symbiodinium natans TaxID=878477 RepID=A0A812PC54_9DINO|nr:unnamed protein product [Symbiodinium natans]